MKLRVTFKDPDSLHDQLHEQIQDQDQYEEISDMVSKWFKYSEYITVEIDTELNTIVVLEEKDI